MTARMVLRAQPDFMVQEELAVEVAVRPHDSKTWRKGQMRVTRIPISFFFWNPRHEKGFYQLKAECEKQTLQENRGGSGSRKSRTCSPR